MENKAQENSVQFTVDGFPTSYAPNEQIILTFGVFDGFQKGQRMIVQRVKERAQELQVSSGVIIFRPRPMDTLGLRPPLPYLSALDETIRLIKAMGIDYVGVINFTKELAETSARPFLMHLYQAIPIRELWLGPRATVGKGQEGSPDSVREIGKECGFAVEIYHAEETIRKDAVQRAFNDGDLEAVADNLERPYILPGYAAKDVTIEGDTHIYAVLFPKLLYVPPDGYYLVQVQPASFDDLPPADRGPSGYQVLAITSGRGPNVTPEVMLYCPLSEEWEESFIHIEFISVIDVPAKLLWPLASDLLAAREKPDGGYAENTPTPVDDAAAPELMPLHSIQP